MKKKIMALLLTLTLVCAIPITANAVSGSFNTTGGTYNKSWNYSLSSRIVASAFYRLTGSIEQPGVYKFDTAKIKVTLYCNDGNVVKNASGTDTYSLSTYADGSTGVSNGTGSLYINVSDDTYGKRTVTYYN